MESSIRSLRSLSKRLGVTPKTDYSRAAEFLANRGKPFFGRDVVITGFNPRENNEFIIVDNNSITDDNIKTIIEKCVNITVFKKIKGLPARPRQYEQQYSLLLIYGNKYSFMPHKIDSPDAIKIVNEELKNEYKKYLKKQQEGIESTKATGGRKSKKTKRRISKGKSQCRKSRKYNKK